MTLSYSGRHHIHDSPWTDELIARLKELWAEGYSASQIANELHNTRNGVIGKANRLGLPSRKPRNVAPPKVRRQKPAPKPEPASPPPTLPVTLPPMRRLTLLELAPRQCRFPIGEPTLFFCGADAEEIYCLFHQRMARRLDGRVER